MRRVIHGHWKIMGLLIIGICFILGGVTAASEVPALRDAKDAAERSRVEALIQGAKKEGTLSVVATMVQPEMYKYVLEGFNAYYGLSTANGFTYTSSGRIPGSVEQLIKAGRPTPDIVWNVSWAWYKDLLARKQVMRYESPYYKDYTISEKAGNSFPGYWVSDSYTFSPMWSPTKLAKSGIKNFQPTSWLDFTNPRLAKVLSIGNISRSMSYSATFLGVRKVIGNDWFKKMAQLKPALYVKSAQGRDWIISGEYPITLTGQVKNAALIKKAGVDVKLLYPKEGIVLLPFAPIITTAASHPNTAKLFIDYIRSVPGTNRFAASGVGLIFGRPGVKTPPQLQEFLPSAEKVKFISMNWDVDGSTAATKEIQQWVRKIGLAN
jgi:ABC-type Fe3+ transport system substrate-binding protein